MKFVNIPGAIAVCILVFCFVFISGGPLYPLSTAKTKESSTSPLQAPIGERYSRGDQITNLPLLNTDKKPFPLKKILGKKIVVFTFWLDVCDKCLKQMKELEKFLDRSKLKDRVEVVAVARGATREEIQATLKTARENRLPFHIALDPDLSVAHSFIVTMVPAFLLVDEKEILRTPPVYSLKEPVHEMNFLDFIAAIAQRKDISSAQFVERKTEQTVNKLIGQNAPDFALTSIDGDIYRLKDFHGQNLLMVFLHIDCPQCKQQLSTLQKYYNEKHEIYDFQIFTIPYIKNEEDSSTIKNFVHENKIAIPVLLDLDMKVREKYHVEEVQTIFVISRDGRIIGAHQGLISDLSVFLDPILQSPE